MTTLQLGISISHAAARLAQQGQLPADYIVWYGQIGTQGLAEVLPHKPLLLHDLADSFWLNYADPFDDAVMRQARTLLDQMRCPWLSTGIGASAEPQAHRHGPYREANPEDVQPREQVIENILRNGRRLQEWAGIPLLLDLGHARISAQNMADWNGDTAGYLAALPLDRVREIHFNRPGWQHGQRVDLHQPVCADDLAWLKWVLDRAPAVEAVTLEIEETDEATILNQMTLLRELLPA